MMLRKLLTISLFIVCFVPLSVLAQTGSIEGTVIDGESDETLPGVNVVLVELDRGSSTDAEGQYEITNVEPGTYQLRVSYVGYNTYTEEVTVTANSTLQKEIVMQPDVIALDDMVVTGYTTELESEVTGSISSVSTDEIENIPVENAGSVLQGRVSGVQVSATSGQPGGGTTIRIRGEGSINADSRPLYIVDGVPMSFSGGSSYIDQSPLNKIDPDNIESIEVLKDAAATAIYGAQGGNGVVLITTKEGVQGRTRVTARVSRGVSQSINKLQFMDTEQWLEYFTRGYQYTFGIDREEAIERVQNEQLVQYGYSADTPFSQVRNTDWLDFTTRQGSNAKYNLSFQGGDETTQFYVAGSYQKTEGQIKSSDFNQYGLSTTLNHSVNSKLSFNLDLELNNSTSTGVCEDGFSIGCPTSGAVFEPPIAFPYLENGEYNPNVRFGRANNLALVLNEIERTSSSLNIIGSVSGTYEFTPWMSLDTQFGMDFSNTRDKLFQPPIAAPSDNGSINTNINYNRNFTTNSVLNISQSFYDVHNFRLLVGGEYRQDYLLTVGTEGIGLPGPIFDVLSATTSADGVSGQNEEFRTAGYFSNIKYNYDERYYIEFTGRYSGSSRFGASNIWGFFPAVSGSWRITQEDFFTSEIFNELKLRGSYGKSGNSYIGNYAARGLYSVSGSYNGITGLAPSQLANPNLTWEESTQFNLGVDFEMLEGRLSGTLNAYQKTNSSLLLDRPLPGDTNFEGIISNVGTVQNRGIEFNFRSVNIEGNNFQWSTRFNATFPENKVIELSRDADMLEPSSNQPIAVGHSINAIYTERWAGVNPADGRPMWYNKDGHITYNPDMDDAKFIGDGDAEVIAGFGNSFSYNGLTLNLFMESSLGKKVIPSTVYVFGIAQIGSTITNGLEQALTDSWSQPGDIVGIPAPDIGPPDYPGTGFYDNRTENAFYNASYIRLKNVSLNYDLPTSMIESLNISGINLFIDAYNLYTFTNFPGADPEVSGNYTDSTYPVSRRINGGIKVQF